MAGIIKRNGVYYACWKNGARVVQKSTGIKVKPDNMTAKKAEALARQQAEAMEQAAKGSCPMDKLTDAIRGAAEMSGLGSSMPSWGRSNGGFTADVIRETVGHDSEAVEQGYFTCALDLKAKVLDAAADAVQGAPLAYSIKTA